MFLPNEKFNSPADVRQKVDQTIIRYNGKAFYARHNGDSDKITLYKVEKGTPGENRKGKSLSFDDNSFDFSSPPLGFMNVNESSCIFLSRIPSRRFSSGLAAHSLEGTSLNGQRCNLPFEFPWSDDLRKVIEDEYVPATTILRNYKDKETAWSQAFSRNLAFGFTKTNGLRLFHKHIPIAFYNPRNTGFQPTGSGNFLVDTILHKHGLKSYVA